MEPPRIFNKTSTELRGPPCMPPRSLHGPPRTLHEPPRSSMCLYESFHGMSDNIGVRVRVRVRCPTLSGTPWRPPQRSSVVELHEPPGRPPRNFMELHGGLHGGPWRLHGSLHGGPWRLRGGLLRGGLRGGLREGPWRPPWRSTDPMDIHGGLHRASMETPWRSPWSLHGPSRTLHGPPWSSMYLHESFHGISDNIGVRVRVRCPTLSGNPWRPPQWSSVMELHEPPRRPPRNSMETSTELHGELHGAPWKPSWRYLEAPCRSPWRSVKAP